MIRKKEFYPCNKKDCKFYGEWVKEWDGNRTYLVSIGLSAKLTWCLSCTNFIKQNNFILRMLV